MEPVATIEPTAWMRHPATQAVVAALSAEGSEVRFVGGCVRDSLAGRPVGDIDIATPDAPETVMALLEQAGIQAIATGLDHGTVTAVKDHHPFEITTLREDVETHGRHATVAFTDDWLADAARRDFTFNALSLSPAGALYDPFDGRRDLEEGRVRFVGDAATRIEEDYLRILRFFRFYAQFARLTPDPDTLAALGAHAKGMDRLSGERIRAELMKLLAAPDPLPALTLMASTEVLVHSVPGTSSLGALPRLMTLASGADPLLRLAALLPLEAESGRVAERLRLSNAEREALAFYGRDDLEPTAADAHDLRVLCYRHGAQRVRGLVLLSGARLGLEADDLAPALDVVEAWEAPAFPLKGRDALELGLAAGPEVGRALKTVEDWWIAEDFAPGREACLERLKAEIDARSR